MKNQKNIRNNGGWEEWTMLLVENFPCTKKTEADVRERYWIDYYKSQLNTYIPGRTKKEWINDHKKEISEYQKEWYNEHKEKVDEYQKEWYNEHKKEISEKLKEKIECECGCFVRKHGITEHKKTFRPNVKC